MRNRGLIIQPTVERFLFYIGEGSFLSIIFMITTLLLCNHTFYFSEGVIIIQEEKKYYNQNEIVKEINLKTGCSLTDIYKITNALGDVVKDKFSDKDNYVELKLFPGLKVTSRYIPSEQSVSKRLNINSNYSIFMSAVFTDDFRKKVRELHNNLE